MTDIIERIVETARGRFGVRAVGPTDGPLVLCLHGFPDIAATFDGVLRALAAAGYRAVAPSARGYAPSPLALPEGENLFQALSADAIAIADALAGPEGRFAVVGHDNGAFATYSVLARAAPRTAAAVTLAAAHPAAMFKNTGTSPRQIWRSRYAMFFQIPRLSEWYVARDDFAYLEGLWRRWSPAGATLPTAHLAAVKRTMRESWPAPLLHFRAMPFKGDETVLRTPTLYMIGAEDGCVLPATGAGQERFFGGPFRSEVLPGCGHFPHLDQPDVLHARIAGWLREHWPAR